MVSGLKNNELRLTGNHKRGEKTSVVEDRGENGGQPAQNLFTSNAHYIGVTLYTFPKMTLAFYNISLQLKTSNTT